MSLKEIALGKIHESLGAQMVPFAGYNMPLKYSSLIEEHKAVRTGVGVFDVSHMGEFLVRGPEAADLIQWISSNDATTLYDGKAQYSCLPNEKGGIVDDFLIYQFRKDYFMLVVNASNIEKDWNWINSQNKFKAELENISDRTSLFAVQGPKAQQVCQRLTPEDLSTIDYYHFRQNVFADVPEVIISATGYTGSGGFELYVPNESVEKVWNHLMEAGKEEGIVPVGLGARDTLRLEKGFCLYGNDINDHTSPLEAGLGWITKLDTDFVGADVIRKQKEAGIQRKLVGFEMIDRGIPRQGYEIYDSAENKIGVVTSGSQSPIMNKGIGLGYVSKEQAKAGNTIYINIRNKMLKAELVKLPIYKD
ncbi:MAG: glycine cleavage system aminomethyltransferase GcvT [Cyclobacteriaceae bacterium]